MPRDDCSHSESPEVAMESLISEEKPQQQKQLPLTATPERRLIQDLRRAYQVEVSEDARSLERVFSRLLQNRPAPAAKAPLASRRHPTQKSMLAVQHPGRALAHKPPLMAPSWSRRLNLLVAVLCLVLLVGSFLTVLQATRTRGGGTSAHPASVQERERLYTAVDQVSCDQFERVAQHLHVHVSIYINGHAVTIPADVGIPQNASGIPICLYWLHTHDASGVIHIESPANKSFIFGQFRDEWHQKFQSLNFPDQLLRKNGWRIWLNGHAYAGTLESIPLTAHSLITLAYNSPHVHPDTQYVWGGL